MIWFELKQTFVCKSNTIDTYIDWNIELNLWATSKIIIYIVSHFVRLFFYYLQVMWLHPPSLKWKKNKTMSVRSFSSPNVSEYLFVHEIYTVDSFEPLFLLPTCCSHHQWVIRMSASHATYYCIWSIIQIRICYTLNVVFFLIPSCSSHILEFDTILIGL